MSDDGHDLMDILITAYLQAIAQDKEGLMKLKKSVKDIQQSGTSKSMCKLKFDKYWSSVWFHKALSCVTFFGFSCRFPPNLLFF